MSAATRGGRVAGAFTIGLLLGAGAVWRPRYGAGEGIVVVVTSRVWRSAARWRGAEEDDG